MTLERCIVMLLFALAAALPILGISLAVFSIQRRKREMRTALAEVYKLHREGIHVQASGGSPEYHEKVAEIMARFNLPPATNSDVLALHLSIANTWTRLSWPSVIRDGSFVAIGLTLGAVASISALFLPPW